MGRGAAVEVEVSKHMEVLRGRGLRHRPANAFATRTDDEEAAYAIALSARRYSRRTKSLVDDKLSFSATLMRAGEVTEASRAMAKFEDDMRGESAALMEQVRALSAGQSGRCRHRTRPLLSRLLGTALMGMSLLSVSVAGAAVAGFVFDRPSSAPPVHQRLGSDENPARSFGRRTVWMAPGVKVQLGHRQLRTYRRLMSGGPVDSMELEAFFEALPPDVAAAVRQVLAATGVLSRDQAEAIDLLLGRAQAAKEDAENRAAEEAESSEEAANEPGETETEEEPASGSADRPDNDKPASDGGDSESSLLPELPLELPTP